MKRIIVFCIAALLLATCIACGEKAAAAPAEATAAPEAAAPQPVVTAAPVAVRPAEPAATAEPAANKGELADKLAARWMEDGLAEDMYPLTAEDALDYYGIDLSACFGGVVLGDAAGYANEAVIVEAEEAVLDEAEAMLRDHLQAVKAQYKGYDAEALALAEKAVLLREGDAVLYIVSPNAEAMLAVYRELTK